MRILSRDFTFREKLLLLLLALMLIGLSYYRFIDQPVRTAINSAKADEESIQIELTAVQNKLAALKKMEAQLDDMPSAGTDYMASYNNRKAELRLLNDILAGTESYSISFNDVTRKGNQIRRNFNLQFAAGSYEAVERVLRELADGPYRCILNEVLCTTYDDNIGKGAISASVSATFFETMVGCTETSGIPEDSSGGDSADAGAGDDTAE